MCALMVVLTYVQQRAVCSSWDDINYSSAVSYQS